MTYLSLIEITGLLLHSKGKNLELDDQYFLYAVIYGTNFFTQVKARVRIRILSSYLLMISV